ncbi:MULTISPECIES: hypothetical protein [Bradyrhizobium]|uniref:hypothetical protein n=1 Tax=Bradyrhizobium pachyrhizi TaxID=280333 RepID=UPI000484FD1A
MTRERLSLQQLNEKISEVDEEVGKRLTAVETDVRTRFAEQRSTVDGIWLVWRSITLGVIGALLVALFITVWPTMQLVGNWIAYNVSERDSTAECPRGQPSVTSSVAACASGSIAKPSATAAIDFHRF